MYKLAISLLEMDYRFLEQSLKEIEAAGVDYVHIDVMDGAFVPSLGIGPKLMERIRSSTELPFDVHMMVQEPLRLIPRIVQAGADMITVHYEACEDVKKNLVCIREYGRRAGIALNPETPLEVLNEELLEQVDVVHLMTTCPGVEGQSFIPESMEKIALLRKRLDSFRPGMDLEVDGNITMKSIGRVARAGANVLVSGRALVQGNMTENIRQMRNILQSPERGNVYEVCAGVDLGTSATKTILVDEKGLTVASKEYAYPMYQPQNGWAEQDPHDWKRAVLETISQVVKEAEVKAEQVVGIGLSGQMHGCVMLDEKGEPLGRTILWCDQRSDKQVDEMLELLPMEKWLEISSNPPLAAWTAAKILWIRENQPEVYEKCRHILLPKDYIRYVLTGEFATDVSDATGMQLLDVENRCWSKEILEALKIDERMLGKVYESQEITGYVLPEIAEMCGLTVKTAVVAGGSDNACAAVGTGIVQEGQAFVTLGTSSVVYTHFNRYIKIPEGGLHVCCCAVPGCWHSMGGPMSAGLSIEWFKDKFCQDLVWKAKEQNRSFYDMVTELTDQIPIGSERLIYLPFLMGERTPHMDPFYRGAFLGLNTVHTQAHMLRAIMEGVVYCLADCNNMLKEQGIEVNTLRVCGGGSRSIVYRKMLAALFRCEIHRLDKEEGAAYGAAILAGAGTGIYSSIQEACNRFIKEKDTTSFTLEDADKYQQFHQIYDEMYEALRVNFTKLAKL